MTSPSASSNSGNLKPAASKLDKNLQISITGEPGCGKTTVARLLCERLQLEYTSTGSIQREIAAQMGITTLELNRLAETDSTIDQRIDAHTIALGESGRSVLVDSRLAWRFLPRSLKVFLVCPPEVAASRVFDQNRSNESYRTKEEAIAALIARFDSEKLRFAKYYGASLGNLRNYDVVINTSAASPEQVAEVIVDIAQARALGHSTLGHSKYSGPLIFACPAQLLTGPSPGPRDDEVLRLARLGKSWAVVTGRKAAIAAQMAAQPLVSAELIAQDDEVIETGITARSFIARLAV